MPTRHCNNLAIDLALLGQFDEAYRLQKQAHDSFLALHDTSAVITTEMNLADLAYTQGYYGSALRRYYDALEIMTQHAIDEPPLLATLKLWMANCFMKLHRVHDARQLAEEAVAIQRSLDPSFQTSNALREYAMTLAASGKLEPALVTLHEASGLFREGGLDYYAAITRLQRAELLLQMGRVEEAYDEAAALKIYFDEHNLVSRSVRVALVIVGALKIIGQPEAIQQAIELGKHITASARRHNLQEEVYKGHYLLAQLFQACGDARPATRHFVAAIAQIERMLDHLVYELSPDFLHTTWQIYAAMIAHCLSLSRFTEAFGYLERARSMALRQHLFRIKLAHERGHEGGEPDEEGAASQSNSATVLRLQKELNASARAISPVQRLAGRCRFIHFVLPGHVGHRAGTTTLRNKIERTL